MVTPGGTEDRRGLQIRLVMIRVVTSIGFLALAISFWVLQVFEHDKYKEMADNNHLRTIPLRAPRGVLFDRDGRVLVENRYSFTIAIIRERSANVNAAVKRLAAAVGADEALLQDVMARHKRDPLFAPIPIIEHASFPQVAAVRARGLELPEVVVQQVPTRAYPPGGFAAHLFGYVSEIQEAQLDRPEFAGAASGAIVGQAGLEKVYNAKLMGTDGDQLVVVNSVGREIDKIGEEPPVEGQRMQLTIDADLQHALEEAFHAGNMAGSAVFMNPKTGEILAMTSQPAYDPNDFATGIDRGTWAKLNNDPLLPLQDRLIQGKYQPGSTFKVVVTTAALSEGLITPDFKVTCPGYATFYGHTFQCDKHEAHGTLDLRHAIAESCNVYFYTVGNLLKIDQIHEYAEKLGLTGKTGIDLPNESESLVPSTEWKMRTTGEKWYPGETISVAIGQGQVTVTPISLATMITTVANGGTVVVPHVVRAVDDGTGWKMLEPPQPRSVFQFRPDVLQVLRDGLWNAVNGTGTAGRARIEGRDVAGKTGTAQVISKEGRAAAAASGKGLDLRDNSWFEFFAPVGNAEISGVVFVEHGGYGAASAVPIAKYMLMTYFAKKDGQPMPTLESAGITVPKPPVSTVTVAPGRSGGPR
jgi:penicillin-binding protein 2